MQNIYYVVKLEWYDNEFDREIEPARELIFDGENLEAALMCAHNIAYTKEYWEKFGKPRGVYLFRTEMFYEKSGWVHADSGLSDDDNFLVAYMDCHKYLHR